MSDGGCDERGGWDGGSGVGCHASDDRTVGYAGAAVCYQYGGGHVCGLLRLGFDRNDGYSDGCAGGAGGKNGPCE